MEQCLVISQEGRYEMKDDKPRTKILVDGGDPNETLRIRNLLGLVDGQTTNPSLIANLDITWRGDPRSVGFVTAI